MDLFQSVFERIDNTVINDIAAGTANLLNVVAPAIQAVFVVYVMFVVWSYWQNAASIEATAIDMIKRIVAIGLILSLSVNLSSYNAYVMPLVLGLGDGLSQTFTGAATSNASSLDALAGRIVEMVAANANAAYETPGIAEKIGSVLNATLNNAMIIITSTIFLVIAAAYIILVKVFLAILAVLGPIFISLLLFPATRQYGVNWINQVLNYSLLTLLINIAGGFFINYINGVLTDMSAVGSLGTGAAAMVDGLITTTGMVQIVLATLLFVVILWKLPELASSLAGGVAAGGFSQLMNTARMATQLSSKGSGKSGKGGGGGSIKSTKAEAAGR